jgi:uncharacterized protein (DUF433 family)
MTHEEILSDYEDLEENDLLACLLFAKLKLTLGKIYDYDN